MFLSVFTFYGFWLSARCTFSWLFLNLRSLQILTVLTVWTSVLETVCPIFAMNTLLCRTESICLRLNAIRTKKSYINSSWCQVRNSSSEKKDDSNVNGKRLYNWSYLHILTYAFIVSKNDWLSLSREIFLELVDTFIPFSKSFYFFSAPLTHIFTFTEIWQQFLTAFLTLEGITFCCLYFSRGFDVFENLGVNWQGFLLSWKHS